MLVHFSNEVLNRVKGTVLSNHAGEAFLLVHFKCVTDLDVLDILFDQGLEEIVLRIFQWLCDPISLLEISLLKVNFMPLKLLVFLFEGLVFVFLLEPSFKPGRKRLKHVGVGLSHQA